MTDNNVTLKRGAMGDYSAMVRGRGAGGEPFLLTVERLPESLRRSTRWVVHSDNERGFDTLKEARRYVNNFFEEVS
jgi:hypothetical protein